MIMRLFRSTAFRLTAMLVVLFTLCAGLIFAYIANSTDGLMRRQVEQALNDQVGDLALRYHDAGVRGLVRLIEARSRQPGANVYLLADTRGRRIAGNIAEVAPDVLERPGFQDVRYRYVDVDNPAPGQATAQVYGLEGNLRLLVGRDNSEQRRFFSLLFWTLLVSLALFLLLALAGGFLVNRLILRRLDGITRSSRRIMAGNIAERMPLNGSGDAFDRLSENLNLMLERNEHLLAGLRDVSHNIAHDLKSPLTRMRNRAQAVLAAADDKIDRDVLEAIMAEADRLLAIFNALLNIARIEAGAPQREMTRLDSQAVLNDIRELYEPLAEDHNLDLVIAPDSAISFHGQRELIAQALVNLIDNAIKYAHDRSERRRIHLGAEQHGDEIVLWVADRGPGIEDAQKERVLERFTRLEASRSQPGAGLGLSLAAAVARFHAGELVLQDNNPGLRACLRLPRLNTASAAGLDTTAGEEQSHRR